jgi:DnaJ-class molecular chaperone
MDWKIFDWQSQKVGQKGEVLNRSDYRCGFCKGKGIISKVLKCPVCSGIGRVRIVGWAVICAYCNGDGRAYLNRALSCSVCKGKGVVNISSRNIKICPTCNGKGREARMDLFCLICKGKGVIPA